MKTRIPASVVLFAITVLVSLFAGAWLCPGPGDGGPDVPEIGAELPVRDTVPPEEIRRRIEAGEWPMKPGERPVQPPAPEIQPRRPLGGQD